MIPYIVLVVWIAFTLDMVCSYNYIKRYKAKFPKNDWTLVEVNPIIRDSIKRWGLGQGIIYGGAIVAFILTTILVLVSENLRWFLAGVFYMVLTFHFLNFRALKNIQLEGGKK